MSQLSQQLHQLAADLAAIADRLDAAEFRNRPPLSRARTAREVDAIEPNPAAAPPCPVHGSPMKISRHGGGFFCPQRAPSPSGWCQERAA